MTKFNFFGGLFGSTEIFASNSEKSEGGHGSHVAASAMGGCGHRGHATLSVVCARKFGGKSNSRESHFRVVLVYKLLVTMSLLELGPVIFGGTEAIISYFRAHRLLATSCICTRFAQFCNINHDM